MEYSLSIEKRNIPNCWLQRLCLKNPEGSLETGEGGSEWWDDLDKLSSVFPSLLRGLKYPVSLFNPLTHKKQAHS